MTPRIWIDGESVAIDAVPFDIAPDTPAASSRAGVRGHFAGRSGDAWVRDPLGVHKLFVAWHEGAFRSSQYAIDLVRAGVPLTKVASVPSGSALRVVGPSVQRVVFDDVTLTRCADSWRTQVAPIRRALQETFGALARTFDNRPIYVTLSGGLDSSGIAALAAEAFTDVRAVTFVVSGDGDSDDVRSARVVSEHLGLSLDVVRVERDALLAGVDDAIIDGQDFRDFNLHCALVNQALGRFIAARHPDAVVLTGDGMNELVCDYTPVDYAGQTFYPLPRLGLSALRRVLVRGLDAGDREVGVFGRCGLETIQPYLLCAREYLALPIELLEQEQAKPQLAREVFGERIPESVYQRPKVRAQVGSESGAQGTLATMVDAGFTGDAVLARAAELYRCEVRELRRWIRGGMYRFPTRFDPLGGLS